jgi:hypothetical protein
LRPLVLNKWLFDVNFWRLVSQWLFTSLNIILSDGWVRVYFPLIFRTDCHVSFIIWSKRSKMSIILPWTWILFFWFFVFDSWFFDSCRLDSWLGNRILWVVIAYSWVSIINILLLLSNCEWLHIWSKLGEMAIVLTWVR